MPEQLAFNMDCLEAMRQMEDNAFDLAVVDPPYGDAGGSFNGALVGRFGGRFEKYHLSDSQSVNVEREREREPTTTVKASHIRPAKFGQELRESAAVGARSTEKNYFVGCSAGARIL